MVYKLNDQIWLPRDRGWYLACMCIMLICTEIYYANILRISFEIRIELTFGIKITFHFFLSDLFPHLWAEFAPEQALLIGGMACEKG